MMVSLLFIIGHMGLFFYNKRGSIIPAVDLPTTEIIEPLFKLLTFSPSRSVRCETNKPPAMRVRVEGYTKNSKRDTIKVFKPIVKRKEKNMAQKAHSLSHTKWMCKYHIVFTPKYRRKVIYNQYRSSLGEIFHQG